MCREGSAQLGRAREKWLHPRCIPLNMSWILPGPSGKFKVGRAGFWGVGRLVLLDLPWEGVAGQTHGKVRGIIPHPRATQLSLSLPDSAYTSIPQTQVTDYSTGCELLRAEVTGSLEGELLLFPRLLPYVGECSTQERWCVQFGKGTQHRDSGGCPFSSLPRATKPSLSSHNVVPLLAVLPPLAPV